MQTAIGVFGSESHADGGNENFSATSALHCPQIMAVELCRDRLVWLKSIMFGFLNVLLPETYKPCLDFYIENAFP